MPICEWCGKEFDLDDASDEFESETHLLSYQNLKKCLCGECSVQVIEDKVDGIYYETCEKCGKHFDLITEETEFERNFNWYDSLSLRDFWEDGILCSDCAYEVFERQNS